VSQTTWPEPTDAGPEPEPEAEAEPGPPATHKLALADGRIVDSHGAVPSHVSDDKGETPVVSAWEV
jgi:hypothetical protein